MSETPKTRRWRGPAEIPGEHPLITYRRLHELDMTEFAKIVDVERLTIWRIETGKQNPGADLTRRITKATGIKADALLEWVPPGCRSAA